MSRSLGLVSNPPGRQLLSSFQPPALAARRIPGSCRPAVSASGAAGDGLVAWVAGSGGLVNPSLQVVPLGGDRGYSLRIFQDVPVGTPLVRLSPACYLSSNPTSSPPSLANLYKFIPEELWGARLALQVLHHRLQGRSSPFSPYIENLPQGFSGMPIFWGKEAIDALAYPPVCEQVKKRCRWLYTFSKDVLSQLPGRQDDPFGGTLVDLNAMGWAFASVTSRAFRLTGRDPCMLPLVDMCNHSLDPNCEVVLGGDGFVSLSAKRKLAVGEVLDISYGPLGNDFLLLDYGFLMPDNPYDRVQLRFSPALVETGLLLASSKRGGTPPPVLMTPVKEKILQHLNLVGKGANMKVDIGGSQLVDLRLLAGVRVLLCKDEGLLKKATTLKNLGAWDHPLSVQLEATVLEVLAGVCAFSLANFPSTIDADLALLHKFQHPSLNMNTMPDASDSTAERKASSEESAGTSPAESLAMVSRDMLQAIRFRVECMKVLKEVLMQLEKKRSQLGATAGAGRRGMVEGAGVGKTNKGFGKVQGKQNGQGNGSSGSKTACSQVDL